MEDAIILMLIMLIGLAACYAGINRLKSFAAYRNWSTVEGTVLSKAVGTPKILPGTDQADTIIEISYSFMHNNKEFVGTNYYSLELDGGEVKHMRKAVEKKIARITDIVSVTYNPQNPEECFLVKGNVLGLWLLIVFGILSVLISGIVCMVLWR